MDKIKKEEMFVVGWTLKKKYNCPKCNELKTIKHPDYICKKCKTEFQLKIKMG